MSVDLQVAAAEYLAERRARGYCLADHDWLFSSFLDDLQACGGSTITVADAVTFAQQPSGSQRLWQAARLRAVRAAARSQGRPLEPHHGKGSVSGRRHRLPATGSTRRPDPTSA